MSGLRQMTPAQLCAHIARLSEGRLELVDGACAELAVLLACMLRERGVDARVVTGRYMFVHDVPENIIGLVRGERGPCVRHAYVRVPGMLLDASRGQLEPGPLALDAEEARGIYIVGGDWNEEPPPVRPTRSAAKHFIARRYAWDAWAGTTTTARLSQICEHLDLGPLEKPSLSLHEQMAQAAHARTEG